MDCGFYLNLLMSVADTIISQFVVDRMEQHPAVAGNYFSSYLIVFKLSPLGL